MKVVDCVVSGCPNPVHLRCCFGARALVLQMSNLQRVPNSLAFYLFWMIWRFDCRFTFGACRVAEPIRLRGVSSSGHPVLPGVALGQVGSSSRCRVCRTAPRAGAVMAKRNAPEEQLASNMGKKVKPSISVDLDWQERHRLRFVLHSGFCFRAAFALGLKVSTSASWIRQATSPCKFRLISTCSHGRRRRFRSKHATKRCRVRISRETRSSRARTSGSSSSSRRATASGRPRWQ